MVNIFELSLYGIVITITVVGEKTLLPTALNFQRHATYGKNFNFQERFDILRDFKVRGQGYDNHPAAIRIRICYLVN